MYSSTRLTTLAPVQRMRDRRRCETPHRQRDLRHGDPSFAAELIERAGRRFQEEHLLAVRTTVIHSSTATREHEGISIRRCG